MPPGPACLSSTTAVLTEPWVRTFWKSTHTDPAKQTGSFLLCSPRCLALGAVGCAQTLTSLCSPHSPLHVLLGSRPGPLVAGSLGFGGHLYSQAVEAQSWKSIWSAHAPDRLPRLPSSPGKIKARPLRFLTRVAVFSSRTRHFSVFNEAPLCSGDLQPYLYFFPENQ